MKSLTKASVSARKSTAKDKNINEQAMIDRCIANPLKTRVIKDKNFKDTYRQEYFASILEKLKKEGKI